MEAQRFPEDYDGIIAGCPALDPTDTIPIWAWTQQKILEVPGAYIPASKLDTIAAAVTAHCDAQDAVRDGVIDNPRACHFDPAVLACHGADSDRCLTDPQVQALRQIYSGPPHSAGTDPLWGFQPGGELGGMGWKDWLTGSRPEKSIQYHYALEFYRYMVYDNPHWSLSQFDYARDRDAAKRRLGPIMDATNADLTAFKARGGKLILFHGWNDPALPPGMTPDYYKRVQERMGREPTRDFVRLYMVPGMQHCFGGPGPNAFGQMPPGGGADPRHNISAALENWVETGKAPAEIIATKYENDLQALIASDPGQPLRTRPICAYPQVARWSGTGSTDIAENFTCVTPEP
jgi:feruloyl esterase